jgi:hypothetical protein
MRYSLFVLISLSLLLFSCNDGDIITVELEFDQILKRCGDVNSENYVIYDTKENPFESLTLLFPGSSANDLIFNPTTSPHEGSFSINESSTLFNYRTYNGDPSGLICAEIPSSTVNIIEDYKATSGLVTYTSTFVDVDGTRTVTVEFSITNLDLDILNSTFEFFGTYTTSFQL